MRENMELDEVEKHIGKRIKMLRLAQKISQKNLGEQMGISYQQVQKYETGLNRISVSRLWQFCKILSVQPNVLFENLLNIADNPSGGDQILGDSLATSQDIKLMLAFKKINDGDKRNLIIKICEAFRD